MIQAIIIITGQLLFINELFVKLNTYEFLSLKAADAKTNFINALFQCRFCIRFHLSWMLTILYGCIFGFSWLLLIVPAIVSGITQNTIKNGL